MNPEKSLGDHPLRPTLAAGTSAIEASAVPPTESPQLRLHLAEVGAVLGLDSKRIVRKQDDTPNAVSVSAAVPIRRVFGRVLVVSAACMLAYVGVLAMWPRPPVVVPITMIGEWVTTVPEFADRRLAITATDIFIGTGGDDRPLQAPIVGFVAEQRRDTLVIALAYRVDGDPVDLHAKFIPGKPSRLIFDQPKGLIWELVADRPQ